MAVKAQRRKLGRERDQRRALLRSLADALVLHEAVVTTDAKARALRPHVEKLVTKAREDTLARRRLLRQRVTSEDAVTKLFDELAVRYAERPGGYTRLVPAGYRRGDNTKLTRIEFVAPAQDTAATAVSEEVEPTTKPEASRNGVKAARVASDASTQQDSDREDTEEATSSTKEQSS